MKIYLVFPLFQSHLPNTQKENITPIIVQALRKKLLPEFLKNLFQVQFHLTFLQTNDLFLTRDKTQTWRPYLQKISTSVLVNFTNFSRTAFSCGFSERLLLSILERRSIFRVFYTILCSSVKVSGRIYISLFSRDAEIPYLIKTRHIRKVRPNTQDQSQGETRDPRPRVHLIGGIRNPRPGVLVSHGTRDPKPRTLKERPGAPMVGKTGDPKLTFLVKPWTLEL